MTKALLYLTRKDVAAAAPGPLEMIDAVEHAYLSRAEGRAVAETKVGLIAEGGSYFFSLNAYSEDLGYSLCHNSMGTQIEDTPPGEHHINGLEILATAKPLAVIDSHWMSTWIAAALTGLAARRLARPSSRALGFIATGAQARVNLSTLCAVLPIERAVAHNRRRAGAEAFAIVARAQGVEVEVTEEPRHAVEGMDAVVTSVPFSRLNEPFIDPSWVAPGAFVSVIDLGLWAIALGAAGSISALGSVFTNLGIDRAHEDIDTDAGEAVGYPGLAGFERIVTDDHAQAAHEIAIGLQEFSGPYDTDITELLTGARPGREADDQRIVLAHGGHAIGILALAVGVYERARNMGLGTVWPVNWI